MPDQSAAEFADMFAQTLAYGLFAARCNHTGPAPFQRLSAADGNPQDQPLPAPALRDHHRHRDLDDEPYAGFVDDLAQLLADTDMEAVLRDFGQRTKRQDPVIHFYETFLAAYDAKLRKVRGVYYTPEPVVSYIVRSVDHLLKTRFGCPDGLADTARTDDGQPARPRARPGLWHRHLPLCTVVDHIRDRRSGSRRNAGMWSGLVSDHLLPRLFGFELLMGAYAVAHFKLGMQLAAQDLPARDDRDTWAYDFASDDRLGVFLTNSLEEAEKSNGHDILMARCGSSPMKPTRSRTCEARPTDHGRCSVILPMPGTQQTQAGVCRKLLIRVPVSLWSRDNASAGSGPGSEIGYRRTTKVDGKPLGEKKPQVAPRRLREVHPFWPMAY